MFAYRRPKLENQWNRLNRVLFFVIIIVTTFDGSRAASRMTLLTDCKAYRTCNECTNAKCPWSVLMQMCDGSTTNSTENPVISSARFCPRFSIFSDPKTGQVLVTVSNDRTSLIKRLAINVQCKVDDKNYTVSITDNQIECKPKDEYEYENSSNNGPSFLSVVFDGDKQLRFDNTSDHYVYSQCPANHCNWRDSDYNYYCQWCYSKLPYCDKRKLSDFEYSKIMSDGVTVGDKCAVIGIRELNVSYGNSYILLTVIIHNLDLLRNGDPAGKKINNNTEYPLLTIKVAEHNCSILETTKNMTNNNTCIKCKITRDIELHEGLVVVTYKKISEEQIPVALVKTLNFNKPAVQEQVPSSTQSTFTPSPPSTISLAIPFMISSLSPLTTLLQTTSSPLPPTTSSPLPPTTLSSVPPTTSSPLPPTTSSPLPPTTLSSVPPTTSSPLPPSTQSILLSSPPIINATEDEDSQPAESTKKEAFNVFTDTITASAFSMVFTISIYVSFIAVLCVALVCLKNPRTYDLLTFHFRQQSNEIIRPFDEQHHQLQRLCEDVDCVDENVDD